MSRTATSETANLDEQREPSAHDVARALEFDILFGGLRPRERLVEEPLMQRFGAKRHAVRQALLDLEHIGIVVRSPNRGAAVRDFSAEEVEEITEVRETLHRRAVTAHATAGGAPVDHGAASDPAPP